MGTYKIECEKELKGTFFRYCVKEDNNAIAQLWYSRIENSNDILNISARFTDERYSWIHLYIDIDDNNYQPSEIYMDTYGLKMTVDECREKIKQLEEASKVCELLNDFIKTHLTSKE